MKHSCAGVVIYNPRPAGSKDSVEQQFRASHPIQLKTLLQGRLSSRQHMTILFKMLDSPLEYYPIQRRSSKWFKHSGLCNSLNGALIKAL